jgi:hypothetical protein
MFTMTELRTIPQDPKVVQAAMKVAADVYFNAAPKARVSAGPQGNENKARLKLGR